VAHLSFGFYLVGLPAVRHKHNLKMSKMGWARLPNKVGWPVATEFWLAMVWSLGRADHTQAKHAHSEDEEAEEPEGANSVMV
jgi:hypothetical protein